MHPNVEETYAKCLSSVGNSLLYVGVCWKLQNRQEFLMGLKIQKWVGTRSALQEGWLITSQIWHRNQSFRQHVFQRLLSFWIPEKKKKHLSGKQVAIDAEVKQAVNFNLHTTDNDFFYAWVHAQVPRRTNIYTSVVAVEVWCVSSATLLLRTHRKRE
jgi:hypothetical protein